MNVVDKLRAIEHFDICSEEKLTLLNIVQVLSARNSFNEFRRYIHPDNISGWFQEDIAVHLEQFYSDMIAGNRPKLVIEAPPQHGKSVMIVDFIAWVTGRQPETRTIYTSFSERLGIRANSFLSCIKRKKNIRDRNTSVKIERFPQAYFQLSGGKCL